MADKTGRGDRVETSTVRRSLDMDTESEVKTQIHAFITSCAEFDA